MTPSYRPSLEEQKRRYASLALARQRRAERGSVQPRPPVRNDLGPFIAPPRTLAEVEEFLTRRDDRLRRLIVADVSEAEAIFGADAPPALLADVMRKANDPAVRAFARRRLEDLGEEGDFFAAACLGETADRTQASVVFHP